MNQIAKGDEWEGETEIRWKGLTDKNGDKMYALKQLLPWNDYDAEDKEIFVRHVTRYRKLLDGARYESEK